MENANTAVGQVNAESRMREMQRIAMNFYNKEFGVRTALCISTTSTPMISLQALGTLFWSEIGDLDLASEIAKGVLSGDAISIIHDPRVKSMIREIEKNLLFNGTNIQKLAREWVSEILKSEEEATAAAIAELIGDCNLSELAKNQLNDLGIHSWPEFGAWCGDGASPATSASSGWGETSELGSTETAGNPPGDR